MAGEWADLVDFLKNDISRLEEKEMRNIPRNHPADESKLREQTLKLISVGQVSRAASRLASHGIADLNRPSARDSLQAKFPAKQRALPPSVPRGECVEGLQNVLRSAMLQIERGTFLTSFLKNEQNCKITFSISHPDSKTAFRKLGGGNSP